MAPDDTTPRFESRTALWLGVGFAVAYCLLLWALGGRLASVPHLPDAGPGWYYWVLPERTIAGRVSAWGLYTAHQLFLFWLIWRAQRSDLRYTGRLHRVNVVALGGNAGFALLHVLQTHLWYDGLAQDVNVFTSFGSVAVLLIWVLLMENTRRGLFFGARAPIGKRVTAFARKYHGYYFAWAVLYTFWFHPAEATSGHLVGFLYTLLLMLQGSLFFTRIHVNRWWTLTQEVLVVLHGTMVALMQGQAGWSMFLFGFSAIFIVTQMHGLGWSRPRRLLAATIWLAAAAAVYSRVGWERLGEIYRIPMIDYIGVVALAIVFAVLVRVLRFRGPGIA
ncbi:MAG: hypothetical protein MJB57_08980 [Gemmatimonadetes bacterium]|nr:hypothetical protein [Gemmatimonadota bacterium]